MKKLISILGSTGSVGQSSLKIIDKKKNYFKPYIFSANKNYKLICKQLKKYKPKIFIINDHKTYIKVKKKFKKTNTRIINSFNLNNLKKKSNISILAIPGIAGLQPTITMIKHSKKVLLANKESIICGWNIIKREASKNKTKLLPIDSEHYSIFQLLKDHQLSEIKKIYITASGGPFLNYKTHQFTKIKPSDALKHPKWQMGKKISIDSSTLMNKVLEFVEAQKLFNIPNNKLDIIIHPNSLIHAFAELNNGLTKFIYHDTTMIIPLVNALFDDKLNIKNFYKTNFKSNIQNLSFQKVNPKKFPIIKIVDKINKHPSSPIIINASNEILVEQFLRKKIPFLGIISIIMDILNDRNYKKYAIKKPNNINQIYKIDYWAKNLTLRKIKIKYG